MRLPKEAVHGWLQNITSGSSNALMSFRYQIFRLRKAPLVWNFDNEGRIDFRDSRSDFEASQIHRNETLWLRRLFCQRSNKSFKCFMLSIKRFYVAHKIRFYIMLQHDNVLSKFSQMFEMCRTQAGKIKFFSLHAWEGFCKRANIKCFYDNKSKNLRNFIG